MVQGQARDYVPTQIKPAYSRVLAGYFLFADDISVDSCDSYKIGRHLRTTSELSRLGYADYKWSTLFVQPVLSCGSDEL